MTIELADRHEDMTMWRVAVIGWRFEWMNRAEVDGTGGDRGRAVGRELRLRRAVRQALEELDAMHQPQWTTPAARAAGKEPWVCETCGVEDGSWPCSTRQVAYDLAQALHPLQQVTVTIQEGITLSDMADPELYQMEHRQGPGPMGDS